MEKRILNQILLELPRLSMTAFRSNVGEAWTGNPGDITKFPDGSVLIRNARRFRTGLPAGFSDIFGLQHGTGRFVAIEAKQLGKKPTTTQQNFLDHVANHGGIAGVARSVEDARQILGGD